MSVNDPAQPDDAFSDPPTEIDEPEREPPFEAAAPPAKTSAEIEALVHQGLVWVERIASTLARELGHRVDISELMSIGQSALLDIARDFDRERSVYHVFARRRLRWAMLDGVRRENPTRPLRARALALAAGERVAETAYEPATSPAGPDAPPTQQLRSALQAQVAAMAVGLATADRLTDSTDDADRVVDRLRFAGQVREALAALPPKQRELVERHYFGEERFDQIAASMGVSKSWASRLHAQAMARLAELLSPYR